MNYIGPNGQKQTAGTCYEEIRCWNIQNITDEMRFKDDDWTMDPDNNFQGKNW